MMFRLMTALFGLMLLFGCTEEGTYPISGEPCSETDAVQTLDANDCAVVPTGMSGGF